MPKAARSMPSSSRPASRVADTSRSIISRRTATITTRERGPAGVWTTPSDWKSITASSIGIGMWSGASAWTAAARPFGSSITGRSSERTTIRWLAMPRRTRLGRSCSAKSSRSASASADGSVASPSRRTPGRSATTAPFLTETLPLACTSAAAMWLGSRSSPTTVAERCFFLNTISPIGRAPVVLERASASGLELAPGVLHQADRAVGGDGVEDVRVVPDVQRVRADQHAAAAVRDERAEHAGAAAGLEDPAVWAAAGLGREPAALAVGVVDQVHDPVERVAAGEPRRAAVPDQQPGLGRRVDAVRRHVAARHDARGRVRADVVPEARAAPLDPHDGAREVRRAHRAGAGGPVGAVGLGARLEALELRGRHEVGLAGRRGRGRRQLALAG